MAPSERPVMVLAHYFGGSARSWSPLITALGSDFDCIAPDLPGFGGTPNLLEGPNLDGYVEQFAELAAGRGWIAVGHSMGGKIALGAAVRSDTMAGLILIAPSPPTPEPMTEGDRQEALASFGDRAAAETRVRKASNDALPAEVFHRAVEDEMRVDRRAWTWWLERGSRDDISWETRSVAVPTLVLHGDADRVLGSAVPNRVARDLENGRAVCVKGAGHLLPLEQPEAVAEAIRDFVRLDGERPPM